MRETELTRFWVKGLLPVRKQDGHKGDFGKLLVIGGSVGYTGAPYLAASAAEHSGCGLVYLGVPESIWAIEAAKCAGAMPFPLPAFPVMRGATFGAGDDIVCFLKCLPADRTGIAFIEKHSG